MRRLIQFVLWTLVAIGPQVAQATITFTSIAGASGSDLTTNPPRIFGGLAGATCSSDGDLSTCDSCATAPTDGVCNKSRIYDTLKLRISFKSDKKAGFALLADKDGNKIAPTTTVTSTAKGDVATLEVTWADLCKNSTINGTSGITSCEDVLNSISATTLRIGISGESTPDSLLSSADDDYTQIAIYVQKPDTAATGANISSSLCNSSGPPAGICQLGFYPGDEKVYLDEEFFKTTASAYPTATSLKFRAVRVYFGKGDVTQTSHANGEFIDFELDKDSGKLTGTSYIDKLDNDVYYVFRWATLDEAQNEWNLVSESAVTTLCPTVQDNNNCPYFIAAPSKVVGLLDKDLNCFVATAAYGSPLASKLSDFRKFRHRYLLKSAIGRKFVFWYYHYGPYMARAISQSDWTRALARFALWPVWAFVALSLSVGLFWSSMLVASGSIGIALLTRRLWWRR